MKSAPKILAEPDAGAPPECGQLCPRVPFCVAESAAYLAALREAYEPMIVGRARQSAAPRSPLPPDGAHGVTRPTLPFMETAPWGYEPRSMVGRGVLTAPGVANSLTSVGGGLRTARPTFRCTERPVGARQGSSLVALFRNSVRQLFLTATAAILLSATGCGLIENEENGDKDQKFGAYDIVVAPNKRSIALTPEAGVVTFSINLDAVCLVEPGDLADCEANKPCWKVTASFPFGLSPGILDSGSVFWSVYVNDTCAQRTAANVSFAAARYLASLKPDSLTGNQKSEWIKFTPSSVPSNLKLTPPGGGRLDLTLTVPNATAERQEQPADQPSLKVFPTSQHFRLIGNQADSSTQPRLTYKGPATTISEVTVSGGAGKFKPISPTAGTAIADGARIPVIVQFQTDAFDLASYQALVTISTANGKHNGVTLTGRREQ